MSGRPTIYKDQAELDQFLAYLKEELSGCAEAFSMMTPLSSALGAAGCLSGMFNTPETDNIGRNIEAYGTVLYYPEKAYDVAAKVFDEQQIALLSKQCEYLGRAYGNPCLAILAVYLRQPEKVE